MVTLNILKATKKKAEKYVLPVTRLVARTGIRPSHLTLLSFIAGIASIYFLFKNPWLFLLLSVIAIMLDIIDGSLARYTGKTTTLGFYLDHANDRLINLILILKYNILFNQLWVVPVLYIVHYAAFFILKTRKVIFTRTTITIFFAIGGFITSFYYYGMIASFLMLALGILLQVVELIRGRKK